MTFGAPPSEDWLPMQDRVTAAPGAEAAPFRPTGSTFYGLSPVAGRRDALRGGRRHGPDQHLIYARSAGRAADAAGRADGRAPGSFPAGLALNGPGTRLYAANNLSDTLAVFDVTRGRRLGLVPVGSYPLAVAALADGSKVYVTSERDGLVCAVDPHRTDAAAGHSQPGHTRTPCG